MAEVTQADINQWRESLASPRIIKAVHIDEDKVEDLLRLAESGLASRKLFKSWLPKGRK
jgi:hypothetical protein